MPSTATVTCKIGPGNTLTTKLFSNVTSYHLDAPNEVLTLAYNDSMGQHIVDLDVSAGTTWTLTVSGNNYTLTVT